MDAVWDIAPCPIDDVLASSMALGVSFAMAQVLVRRGLGDPDAARAWLAADERHDPSAFAGIDEAVALVLGHVQARSAITVHGDYDVDGVCSTAIVVRVLRRLGATVDWYLPSRGEDGYGLSAATVARLAARGTRLLITVDCAITAVDEVAAARAAGVDVLVTDHHQPRADGLLPDAPIVHPGVGGYPCADLCAAGVAHKLAAALLAGAGHAPGEADEDLDLVALATVADCVPLRGENRRLVREGLAALRATRKPGLRALMRVSRADPGTIDARAVGFRLAPRINAAGRLDRADAGLELVLTDDDDRAQAVAAELDGANAERRHVETRILFEAQAQVSAVGDAAAYVLAGEGWHPGVIGIVASRIAERQHRPCVLIALEGEQGTASGRSIPGFDLLAGLDACAAHLLRHGGHRAAAGATIARDGVDAFRAAFVAHAAAVLTPEDLVARERVDAVVAGDELGLELAEELQRLEPFGIANPDVTLLLPAARLSDARTMGEGRHLRFSVESGGARARAVAFGTDRLPDGHEGPLDALFRLEANEYNGAVEPRLVLRGARRPAAGEIAVVGQPDDPLSLALAELDVAVSEATQAATVPAPAGQAGRVLARDRRGHASAGAIAALVASGEAVLVICADARARRRHLEGRVGGFALCSWTALERDRSLAEPYRHLVALDPPATAAQAAALDGAGDRAHLLWGEAERAFAMAALEAGWDLRPHAATLYRALRAGASLPDVLAAAALPAAAGRALRVLVEVGLVELDRAALTTRPREGQHADLGASASQRAALARLGEGRVRLAAAAARTAAA